MSKPRVLLADDHVLFLDGLRRILEPDYEIVGQATDGAELIELANKLRPDVMLVDIMMPRLNGLEAIRRLQSADLRAKVIFVTMHTEIEFAVEAIRLGASGYLLKHATADELCHAVHEVLEGKTYVAPEMADEVKTALIEAPEDPEKPATKLTQREREILQLIAEGYKLVEIAKIWGVSIRTVEFHKYNLADKLKTTAELTQYALKHGVISA